MIGRFTGSISMSSLPASKKYFYMALASLGSLCLIFFAFSTSMKLTVAEMYQFFISKHIYIFIISLLLNYMLFVFAKSKPSFTLGLFAIANIVLLSVMLMTTGTLSLWAILSVGLFNSIMFSNIFTLAIKGLGQYTSQGSSLLVMMILGGALIPPLQGMLTDELVDGLVNPHFAFCVPMVCYCYLVWYGFWGYKVMKQK